MKSPARPLLTRPAVELQHRGVKTPLLLIPGLLCDDAVWASQTQALSDIADARVINNRAADRLETLAEAIIARAPPRFALAGHSMGGRIALEVARRVPERLMALALLDTGYEAAAPGEAGEREAAGRYALLATARREGMRAMARIWVRGMVYPPRLDDAGLIERILDMLERRTPDFFALQITALLRRPDAAPVFSKVRCPTLVLCGLEDLWSPPLRHEVIAKRIPGSTLEVIPECGHMSPMESPEAVTAAFRRWLQSIEA